MKKIIEIINSDSVAKVFFSLYERLQDEYKYENINDYGKVLADAIAKTGVEVKLRGCTKRPFGIKVALDGGEYHIFVKVKGRSLVLCCQVIKKKESKMPVVVSQFEYEDMTEEERKYYNSASFIYAHGQLEDDMEIDLIYVSKDCTLVDGLEAEYNGSPIVFHLYDHVFGHRTGVVTYKDDAEAYAYGRKLVQDKPKLF